MPERFSPAIGGKIGGDVSHQTRVRVLIEHAAAPALKDVRRIPGLHRRGELGLESFVLQHGYFNLDVGVIGDKGISGRLHPGFELFLD